LKTSPNKYKILKQRIIKTMKDQELKRKIKFFLKETKTNISKYLQMVGKGKQTSSNLERWSAKFKRLKLISMKKPPLIKKNKLKNRKKRENNYLTMSAQRKG